LIVDDEADVRASLRRALQEPGWTVHEADSAAAALRLLQEREIHVVVSDHRMPAMSGLELLAEIRSLHPAVLRILVTAYPDVYLGRQAVESGTVDRYITKPWDHVDLRGFIRARLRPLRPAPAAPAPRSGT
jgi:DNA-binding NtrC family response regulator